LDRAQADLTTILDRSARWITVFDGELIPTPQSNTEDVMSMTSVDSIQRTVQKTNQWVKDLENELGIDNPSYAYRALRGYLQVLRDRLTIDEAAHLAAELPQLLRGVFYEGFDPGHQPERIRDRETFLARLAQRAQLDDLDEAARVAAAATRVLRRRIAAGEVDDALAQLPSEIREVLENG
jgi:uncharacterized protein (DUF2267 family)